MLHLIDSSIYIFRAWQTLPGTMTNTFGEQANAVFGYADTLARIVKIDTPRYMVCTFDQSYKSGTRYGIYPEYKANRPPAPPELEVQFKRCVQVAKAMGFPALGSKNVEADDIIGICAEVAHNAGMPVTIVSADKDLAQFIHDGDVYWNYAKKLRLSAADLSKRFKVRPDQMADMLALCGDKVDNIPGIPGVGQSTAARLLKKWHTLEGVLGNVDAVAQMGFRGAPRIAQLIGQHKDDVLLARQLTGLIRDDDIPNAIDEYQRKDIPAGFMIDELTKIGFTDEHSQRLANAVANNIGVDS